MTFTPISSAILVWCFAGVGATGEEKRSSLMVWKDGEYHKLCEGRVAADSKNQIKSDSLPAEPKGNVGKSIADHSATAPKSEPEDKEMRPQANVGWSPPLAEFIAIATPERSTGRESKDERLQAASRWKAGAKDVFTVSALPRV
jgi:hypothetical protein